MTRAFLVLLIVVSAIACNPSLPGDPHSVMCLVAFDDARTEAFLEAADEWATATGGAVALRPQLVEGEGACSDGAVRVYLRQDLRGSDGSAAVGTTDTWGEWLAFDSAPEWLPMFRQTALHELGHFLTGCGHSADPRDVMFHVWTPAQAEHLTATDAAHFGG